MAEGWSGWSFIVAGLGLVRRWRGSLGSSGISITSSSSHHMRLFFVELVGLINERRSRGQLGLRSVVR